MAERKGEGGKAESYASLISEYMEEGAEARRSVDPGEIEFVSDKIYEAMKRGNKLMVFGNGGSAADAQHIVGEFICRFLKDRRPLPALALTTNTTNLTAVSNDYSYEDVFSRQVEALGKKGDVVIGITTSGSSPNVIKAVNKAKAMGIYTIGLTGRDGGRLSEVADKSIIIRSDKTSVIQEVHIAIGHLISLIVEERMFG